MYFKIYVIFDFLLVIFFLYFSGILSFIKLRVVIRYVERWRGCGMESIWCLFLGKVERNYVENFLVRMEVKYIFLMKLLFNDGVLKEFYSCF